MGESSSSAWCDHTFDPWVGCQKISPGCANCYAEAYDKRVGGGVNPDGVKRLRWGPGAQRVRTSAANWRQPLRWNKAAERSNTRPRVFCASLADVFDPEVPDMWRLQLFDLIRRTPSLDWLLLTKRPEEIAPLRTAAIDAFAHTPDVEMATVDWLQAWVDRRPPSNAWLGVTAENQAEAGRRIPLLLEQSAVVRFLSCEPLLEALDLSKWLDEDRTGFVGLLDWIIIGGESGPHARPFNVAWARSLIAQCRDGGRAEAAPFVKQLGANTRTRNDDSLISDFGEGGEDHQGAEVRVRLHDRAGADPSEWPADLRVRELPR